jgi:hypothetical protein
MHPFCEVHFFDDAVDVCCDCHRSICRDCRVTVYRVGTLCVSCALQRTGVRLTAS